MAIMTGAAVVKVEMAPSVTMEQDPTQASVPESTDTEMYQALEKELLISNDYQQGWCGMLPKLLTPK